MSLPSPAPSETVDEVDGLWLTYKRSADPDLRNRLVLQYSPLVKYVVGRVRAGLPRSVEHEDLVSEGIIGLMDAIEKFEPERGLQFQTYAVPRIRGAIIDGIRAVDWVPRSVRRQLREVERTRTDLEHRLARTPLETEVAEELGLTVTALREICQKSTFVDHASSEELDELEDLIELPGTQDALEDQETRELLMAAVHQLPERDRIIIAMYFFEGLTLGEIGLVLGITESRVCQLRSRATKALRSRLQMAMAG
ncbi:FliA/WhiG family RNA polymerase sigma factor [Nocardioides sp.]|uniref:FliA/WhiG family RNA polymerase sigma factor n=1 Tax=Nocardioides sp. TaxID=35761 RepID=UPI003568A670